MKNKSHTGIKAKQPQPWKEYCTTTSEKFMIPSANMRSRPWGKRRLQTLPPLVRVCPQRWLTNLCHLWEGACGGVAASAEGSQSLAVYRRCHTSLTFSSFHWRQENRFRRQHLLTASYYVNTNLVPYLFIYFISVPYSHVTFEGQIYISLTSFLK